MSRFVRPNTLSTPIEVEMERFFRKEAFDTSLAPRYLIEGQASFAPPSTNIVQNLFAKSAENSIVLGDGAGFLLNSGAGVLSRNFFPTPTDPIPLRRSGGSVILKDGSLKPASELRGEDFFFAMDPGVQTVLEMQGYSAKNFRDVETHEEAYERFNNIQRRIDLRQKIVRYNEERPFFAGVTGVTNFGLDIVTDPTTLITFGTGALVKGAAAGTARASVSAVSKNAAKALADDGFRAAASTVFKQASGGGIDFLPQVIKNYSEGSRVAAYTLASISGGTQAVGFDFVAQYYEHKSRLEDLGDPTRFQYDFLRSGMSATIGMFFASLGAFAQGRKPKVPTEADVINQSPTSVMAERIRNKARKGSLVDEVRADLVEMDIMDVAEKWGRAAYSSEDYDNLVRDLVALEKTDDGTYVNTDTGQEFTAEELITHFTSTPTYEETRRFLRGLPLDDKNPDAQAPRLHRIGIEFRKNAERIRELREEIRRLTDSAAPEKEIAKAERALKKTVRAQRQLEIERSEAVSKFHFNEDNPEQNRLRVLLNDLPLTDIYFSQKDRRSRTEALIAAAASEVPEHRNGRIQKATSSLFGWLERVGALGTLANQTRKLKGIENNPLAQMITRLYAAYDPRVSDQYFGSPDGSSVVSVHENIIRQTIMRAGHTNAYRRIMRDKTPEQRAAIGAEVMQVRSGVKSLSDVSDEAKELFKHFDEYYERMGDRAINNGSLREKLKGYINISLNEKMDATTHNKLAKKLASWWKERRYDPTDMESPLHLGTLKNIGIIDSSGNLVEGTKRYGEVPGTLADLNDADAAKYLAELDNALEAQAHYAIARRIGRDRLSPEDPVARSENRPAIYRTDNRATRAIEQEFWLQDDVLELGVVLTDTEQVIHEYERGMGAYIAEQETATEIFGEAVRLTDAIDILKSRAEAMDSADPNKAIILEAVNNLTVMRDRTLHHRTHAATGLEKVIQPLVDLTAAAINQGILISMTPEILQAIIPRLFSKSERRILFRHMREIFNGEVSKQDLISFGYAHELEYGNGGRFFGSETVDPVGSIGKGARWWKHTSRKVFGEAFATQRLKRLVYASHHHKYGTRLIKNIDKLHHLRGVDPSDPKTFAAAARSAGFGGDVALARDVVRMGLHTPEAEQVLRALHGMDKEALLHPMNLKKIAGQIEDPELRTRALDLGDNIAQMAREKTDRIIVTRTSGTSLPDNDIIGSMALQFLSYPSSWFNAFLRRESESPNQIIAGYLGLYLAGEIMAAMMRDVAYRGVSPDDALADWEENFAEKSAQVASRIPFAGAWSPFVTAPLISLLTGDQAHLTGSAPAVSYLERTINGGLGTLNDIANGKEVNTQKLKNSLRLFPAIGSPVGQMIIEASSKDPSEE